MKNNIFILLVGAILFISCSKNEMEINKIYFQVNSLDGLDLFEEPNRNSNLIRLLNDGEKVEILELQGDNVTIAGRLGKWAKVSIGKNIGWVFDYYLIPEREDIQIEEVALLSVDELLEKTIIGTWWELLQWGWNSTLIKTTYNSDNTFTRSIVYGYPGNCIPLNYQGEFENVQTSNYYYRDGYFLKIVHIVKKPLKLNLKVQVLFLLLISIRKKFKEITFSQITIYINQL